MKDCEDNSPIVTADPRDELTVFGKTENPAPGSLLASFFSSIFLYYTLLENSYFSSNPMHIIYSQHHKIFYKIYMATST
jgi:hypothetical protein